MSSAAWLSSTLLPAAWGVPDYLVVVGVLAGLARAWWWLLRRLWSAGGLGGPPRRPRAEAEDPAELYKFDYPERP